MRPMTDDGRLEPLTVNRPWGRMRVWRSAGTDPSGTPVIALHGLGGSGRYFGGLAETISAPIIAPDLAGFGHSDEPEEHATRDFHLADLDAVIANTLPPDAPVRLVGFSAGGCIAALWAVDHPDRIAQLVLAGTPFPGNGGPDHRFDSAGDLPLLHRALFASARRAWPALSYPVAFASRFPRPIVEDFGRQSMRARVWTLWSAVSDPDIPPLLEPLASVAEHTPVLLMNATDDATVPIRNLERWRERMPAAATLTMDHGEHQFLLRGGWRKLADWLDPTAAGGSS
jgi:pimeloyl-ACP methyl ester carboxylesterase